MSDHDALPSDPTELTVAAAGQQLAERQLSSVELTQAYLDRIERDDPRLNSYITVLGERALADAAARDAETVAGRTRGPLHGIPIGLKDNIDTAGVATTAASAVYLDRVPDTDAPVVTRLADAGAVVLGKLNMHEFAFGGTSAISHFGPVRNPWNTERTPGGSSGGSAAAVAGRLCAAALGTDTAASVRYPAACCGITGLKATHGLASIRGIVPLSESHDHVGPLTRSVEDAALVMAALVGFDPGDPVSIDVPAPDLLGGLGRPVRGLRIGLPRRPFWDGLHPDVEAAVDAAVVVLGELTGVAPAEFDLPAYDSFPLMLAEIYAYHAGMVADPAVRERYDPVTLQRILDGVGLPATAVVESARQMRLARNGAAGVFESVDVLVTPTAAGPALSIPRALVDTPDEVPLIRNTVPFDTNAMPTISVPCGFTSDGLPIGLQISGPPLGEATVLAVAHAYEQATNWYQHRPPQGG
ncbi:MAG TPA: amidase [Ilumatobacter sp.]|nr:amidase [Ilumatobacter sp.]